MSSIDPTARDGFRKGALRYHSGRPEYPAAIVPWLHDCAGVRPGATVIDLAAGTGKFTKSLLQAGARVIAVEPVDAMRVQLVAGAPDVVALAGTAARMPVAVGAASVVACAQAFHWFATRESLAEIHRVLMPGGPLVLVWNLPDVRVDWVSALDAIVRPFEATAPFLFRRGTWRAPFTGEFFSAPTEVVFAHSQVGAPQEVIVDRLLSMSFIANLPPSEQNTLADRLWKFIEDHPALRGRPTITVPYQTFAYVCARHDD